MHRTTTAATWSVCLAAVAVMAQGAGARGQATTKGTDQTPIARDFLTHMTKGEYEEAVKLCDDTMKQALPADKLKSVWETITSSSGEFQTLGEPTSSMSEGFQVLVFPAKLKTTTLDLRVAVSGEGKISGFYILPKESYKPPGYDHSDKYVETQVEFGEEPWLVKGKLTMPSGKGPYPAVVLVHGSGPHDEDETIGPNKPFRDLAGGLSSNGIAVLRYQKRTFAHKLRLAVQKTITVREEVLDDAEAAVEYLRRTPGIDKNKVFVLGHSMGATLAPQIAAEVKDVAGVILLAGTGRDFYDVLLDQLTYIASAPGAGQEKNRKEKEDVEKGLFANHGAGTMIVR